MRQPFISIVICTHNRRVALEKYAFKSIPLLDYSNFEVVVIDDASTDDTKEFIKSCEIKNLRYVRNKKHKSLCYVRNLGVKESKGDIIAFIDDDCCVDKNWLNNLVEPYLKDKDIMVVGGTSYIGNSDKVYMGKTRVWGCNMSFRKKIFNKFLFDNNLKYSHYHDETELLTRMTYHNIKMFVSNKAIARHHVNPAPYRKDILAGGNLNWILHRVKYVGLLDYYLLLLFNYFGNDHLSKKLIRGNVLRRDNTRLLISDLKALGNKSKRLYPLLLEIPIKAKLKHSQEEKRFRVG